MGADLYIEPIFSQNNKKYSKLFEIAVQERDKEYEKNGNTKQGELLQEKVTEYYNKMYERGYFRDSYNNSSLFWKLGLSWWELDRAGLLDIGSTECGEYYSTGISSENAFLLRELVKETPLVIDPNKDGDGREITGKEFSDAGLEETIEYFEKKKQDFIDFLTEAYEGGYCVEASI